VRAEAVRHGWRVLAIPSAAELRKLPIGQTMKPAYFECIVRQMEMLEARQLPDFAGTYDNIEQLTGSAPMRFRDFVKRNKAQFETKT
jgi:NAD(P)H dehydrogenase (quinone)